jgi:hypothetical protein
MTNTKLVVDGNKLQQALGVPVAVLNDFEAVGYGIPALGPQDLLVLNDVAPVAQAPKVGCVGVLQCWIELLAAPPPKGGRSAGGGMTGATPPPDACCTCRWSWARAPGWARRS